MMEKYIIDGCIKNSGLNTVVLGHYFNLLSYSQNQGAQLC